MQGNGNIMIKRIVDVCMTVLLLCLMAYQVTGEALHEWIGIGMTVLVIIHQLLNRKRYGALFKGKYNSYRIITTVVKLAPDADMGEGLSVHYSGGSSLSDDIQKWLDVNGINK